MTKHDLAGALVIAHRFKAGTVVIDRDLAFIARISHAMVGLNEGRVLGQVPPSEVRPAPAVPAEYLGSPA